MSTTMPETVRLSHATTDLKHSESGPDATTEQRESVNPDELLSMLSDDNAREILKAISREQLPARELAERFDISRSTVYRRLNRLQEIGIVETSLAYDSDGHHRKQFHATLDQVVLSIGADRIAVDHATESSEAPAADATPPHAR
jgi:DNA-binding transcriptional ArsR family regulator